MTTTTPHTPGSTPAPQHHDPNPPHPQSTPPDTTNPSTMTPTTPDEKAAYTALLDTAIASSRAFGAMLDIYISLRDAGGSAAALAACNEALEAPYQAFLRAMGDLGFPAGAVGDDGSEDGSDIDWGFGDRHGGLEMRGGGAGEPEPKASNGICEGEQALGVGDGTSGDGGSEVAEEAGDVQRL